MQSSALECPAVCKMPCGTLLGRPVPLLEKKMPCFTLLYKFAQTLVNTQRGNLLGGCLLDIRKFRILVSYCTMTVGAVLPNLLLTGKHVSKICTNNMLAQVGLFDSSFSYNKKKNQKIVICCSLTSLWCFQCPLENRKSRYT